MATIPTFAKSGAKAATSAKLDKSIFAVTFTNYDLLKLVYDAYLANGRDNLAKTKTRGLVRGGGKKPWRQKGTGRARVGSSRNPVWRGGGIVFGPTGNENYAKRVTLSTKRLALRQALTLAVNEGKVRVIETFECKDGKVAKTLDLLKKVGAERRTLLVVNQKDELVERATRNLAEVKAVHAQYLNVFDVLNADTLVLSEGALQIITDWLAPKQAAMAIKEGATR